METAASPAGTGATDIVTAIKTYPKTMERPVPVGLDQEMPHPVS